MLVRLVLNSQPQVICLPWPPKCLASNFVFLVETEFLHVGQAGLELLTSGNLPASVSQSARITGVSHHAQPSFLIYKSNTGICVLPTP